ncbi:MAG: helix-turn-helix transcriptional regulator [Desulfuromonadales bacterium]|nr:helix-turn-helix transcriptional regulator [Desulfuromonadales bacterium]NIR33884.1 helix-turn-helix transcriptional regulator [Desulfuromonadales bacterium]NIS40035.1 helix-turn-helix transcriptional regulator [Desulfuromonadales bacterium]
MIKEMSRVEMAWIRTDGVSPGIEKALEYVNTHFQAPISVQDVAKHSSLSYHHLCRKFKKETGRTVVELINWLRIEKAKDLLESSPYPIHEIAEKVGFTSTVQFHRTFKKLEKDTPMQYRKKIYGEN